ncbi:30S ribosomal protein S9 [Candidatus Parcubacteria bacterium 4484_255]|nr:MAG: 30S ribosomal protein S9 [Candidatus Parcubacteria bacterium 4484_255]
MIIWATGKRKTAIARVKFSTDGSGEIWINKKPLASCSLVPDLREIVLEPLVLLNREKYFSIKANVRGGGIKSQAEAVRLGIARALVIFHPEWRKELKSAGFLRRDPRKKERKKPGLKRARRAPQWSKR